MHKYTVEKNDLIAKDILSLKLRAKSKSDVLTFNPGQYVAISFYKNNVHSPFRSFSLANSASESEILEFGIKVGGDYTASTAKLEPGDLVEVRGPYGNFISQAAGSSELVFFAGGIGITPFLSYIRTAEKRGWPQKITLLYSVRTFNDAVYMHELAELQNSTNNFNLFLFLTKEDASKFDNRHALSGQISAERIDKTLANNYANKKFFICGPKPFMAAMRRNLLGRMVPGTNILTEEFSASGNQDSVGGSPDWRVAKYVAGTAAALLLVIAFRDATAYSAKLNAQQQDALINSGNSTATVNSAPPTNSSSTSNNSTGTANSGTSGSSSVGSSSTSSQPSYQYNTSPTTRMS